MAARRVVLMLVLGLALSLAWSGDRASATIAAQTGVASTPVASPKVHPRVIADTADGHSARVLVLLADQLDPRPAAAIRDPAARGWYVYDGLRRAAATSQASVRALLDARGVPYRDYWAANALALTADRALVDVLAARPDVRAVESDGPVSGLRPPPDPAPPSASAAPRAATAVEWGVANVNAPQVWSLGATGQGIVLASADTGVQWNHPALLPHYRGWNGTTADHNYHWWDAIHGAVGNPCPNSSPAPCDDDSHGTHTTGTMIGDDGAGNQIGVAPRARWIGCRNMAQGVGTPSTYVECLQFFMAPTDTAGQNPDPTRRAHVVNNSWTCPPSEGCAPLTLQSAVQNAEAAGLFIVAAAGNSGSNCGTVQDPPAI